MEHEGSFLGREAEARAARAEHWHAMMHCRVHGGLVGTVHVSRHDDERGHLAGGNSLRKLDIGGNSMLSEYLPCDATLLLAVIATKNSINLLLIRSALGSLVFKKQTAIFLNTSSCV